MKAVISFVAVSFLAAVVLWQLAHRGAERGVSSAPAGQPASSSQNQTDAAERRTRLRREASAVFNSGAGPTVGDTKTFTITTVETHADHIIKEVRLPAGSDTKVFTRLVLIGL